MGRLPGAADSSSYRAMQYSDEACVLRISTFADH